MSAAKKEKVQVELDTELRQEVAELRQQVAVLTDAINKLVQVSTEKVEVNGRQKAGRKRMVDQAFRMRQERARKRLKFPSTEEFIQAYGNIDYVPEGAPPYPDVMDGPPKKPTTRKRKS